MKSLKRSKIMCAGLLALIFLTLVTSGCWNRVEVNELAIVLGAAIDKGVVEEKIMVTTEVANPAQLVSPVVGGGGGDDPPSFIFTSTGWTIFDAVRNFTQQSETKLFWSHNQIIVIGEELAREGLAPMLDFFIRDHELRRISWVIIAKGTTGKEILSVQNVQGGASGTIIDQLVRASAANSQAVQVNLTDFIAALLDGSRGAVVGRIEIIDPGKPEGIIEESEAETLDIKQELSEGELLRYTGGAIFKGDKLVGWLDRKQSRGYNWVTGNVTSGIIVVNSPEENKPKISIEILETSSTIVTEIIDDKPKVIIEVEIDGNIGGHMGNREISQDMGLMSQLDARTAQVVRNEIEAALAIAQVHKTDIFSFGKFFNRQNHKKWVEIKEEWQEEYFPNLIVDIVVDANIRRTGMIDRPVKPE